jgi:hypothetical protein
MSVQKLEEAVSKVAGSVQALTKSFEKIAADVTEEDMEKAFHYLYGMFIAAKERAALDHRIAQGVSPKFSLADIKLPPKTVMIPAGTIQLTPSAAPAHPVQQVVVAAPTETAIPAEAVGAGGEIDLSKVDGKQAAKLIGGRLTRSAKEALPRTPRVRKFQSVKTDLHDEDDDASADDESEVDFIDDNE